MCANKSAKVDAYELIDPIRASATRYGPCGAGRQEQRSASWASFGQESAIFARDPTHRFLSLRCRHDPCCDHRVLVPCHQGPGFRSLRPNVAARGHGCLNRWGSGHCGRFSPWTLFVPFSCCGSH